MEPPAPLARGRSSDNQFGHQIACPSLYAVFHVEPSFGNSQATASLAMCGTRPGELEAGALLADISARLHPFSRTLTIVLDRNAKISDLDDLLERLDDAERRFDELKHELEQSDRLATLGLMAAGAAHEINNILTPALGYAQLALSHPDDPEVQAKANTRIVAAIEFATQVLDTMLGLAAPSPDEEEHESANARTAAEVALGCLARDPSKDGIALSIQINESEYVDIRPASLQQVFLNLMLNAIEAMKGSGGALRIISNPLADGTIRFAVIDTGPGFPDSVAGRLFDPFFSRPSTCPAGAPDTESNQGGTGLGLSICKRIVEEAGGTIAAIFQRGEGATIAFTLRPAGAHRSRKAG